MWYLNAFKNHTPPHPLYKCIITHPYTLWRIPAHPGAPWHILAHSGAHKCTLAYQVNFPLPNSTCACARRSLGAPVCARVRQGTTGCAWNHLLGRCGGVWFLNAFENHTPPHPLYKCILTHPYTLWRTPAHPGTPWHILAHSGSIY